MGEYRTINSKSMLKCAETMTLSFHIEAVDEIRCYLYMHGGMIRFIPEDIQLILPVFFDKEFGNNAEWMKNKKRWFDPINDVKFSKFLSQYQSKECPVPDPYV